MYKTLNDMVYDRIYFTSIHLHTCIRRVLYVAYQEASLNFNPLTHMYKTSNACRGRRNDRDFNPLTHMYKTRSAFLYPKTAELQSTYTHV